MAPRQLLRARFSLGFSLGFSPRVSLDAVRARGFTCNMPRMHAQARARVWRQHACKTHASAHHSALLAQEGASLWGRRSGPPVPLEVGQLLLILDLCERLLLGRLGGCDRGLVLLRRAERLWTGSRTGVNKGVARSAALRCMQGRRLISGMHARAAAHQWHACKGGGSSVAVHVPRRACMQGRRLISG